MNRSTCTFSGSGSSELGSNPAPVVITTSASSDESPSINHSISGAIDTTVPIVA